MSIFKKIDFDNMNLPKEESNMFDRSNNFEKKCADKINEIWKNSINPLSFLIKRKTVVDKFDESLAVIGSVDEWKIPYLPDLGNSEDGTLQKFKKHNIKVSLYMFLLDISSKMHGEDKKQLEKLIVESVAKSK